MKRLLLPVAAILALTACTPRQVAAWFELKAKDPVLAEQIDDIYKVEKQIWTDGRPCDHAYDAAMSAHFEPWQWPTLAKLCERESRGTLTAVSRTHDYCWWQINRKTWENRLRDAGIIEGSIDELLTDGQKCADAAHLVWEVQGWYAWVTY